MIFDVSVSKRTFLTLALLVLVAATMKSRPLLAQTVYGSVYGTVIDAQARRFQMRTSQSPISKRYIAQSHNQYRRRISDRSSVPDAYTVTVEAAGYKTFTLTECRLMRRLSKSRSRLTVGSLMNLSQ